MSRSVSEDAQSIIRAFRVNTNCVVAMMFTTPSSLMDSTCSDKRRVSSSSVVRLAVANYEKIRLIAHIRPPPEGNETAKRTSKSVQYLPGMSYTRKFLDEVVLWRVWLERDNILPARLSIICAHLKGIRASG